VSQVSIGHHAEHFNWQPALAHAKKSNNKLIGVAAVSAIFIVGLLTYPMWSPVVLSFFGIGNTNAPVVISVAISDGLTDAAFTPSGATCKFYQWPYGAAQPSGDVAALIFICTGTESPDGTFTSTGATCLVGSYVLCYIQDSGNTYYTASIIRQVKPVYGFATTSYLDPIKVYPRSATSSADKTATIMTAGALVTNATNIAAGITTQLVTLTIASAKSWGSAGYLEPTTGYYYTGGFIVYDLDRTTARAELTGGPLISHFVMGVHEYWVYLAGQTVNNANIATDGAWTMTITYNNMAAAADVMTLGFYTSRRLSLINQASFGTSDLLKAENLYQIHQA